MIRLLKFLNQRATDALIRGIWSLVMYCFLIAFVLFLDWAVGPVDQPFGVIEKLLLLVGWGFSAGWIGWLFIRKRALLPV